MKAKNINRQFTEKHKKFLNCIYVCFAVLIIREILSKTREKFTFTQELYISI